MKRVMVTLLTLMVVFGLATPAMATGTPSWWIASGVSPYSTWQRSISSATVSNTLGQNALIVTVNVDVPNVSNPANHKEVWAQVEWSSHGTEGASLQNTTNLIQWTFADCPQSALNPFPSPAGSGVMADQGAFTPSHVDPTNSPNLYQLGRELSFSIAQQPQCERISFQFQIGALSELDYRIEVQTLCFNPNAVTLRSLKAETERSVADLPLLGMVGVPLITASVWGGNTWLRRRRAARRSQSQN